MIVVIEPTEEANMAVSAVCDFCGTQSVVAEYPAEPVLFRSMQFGKPWKACTECSELIEQRHLQGLVERSVACLVKAMATCDEAFVTSTMTELFTAVFAAMPKPMLLLVAREGVEC